MKYLIYILTASTIILSCDCIENPIPESTGTLDWNLYPYDTTSNPYPWPTFTTNNNTDRNILLEDFTGHRCVNCPAAAVNAKLLEDANPGRVFVASVHASTSGAFQAVNPPEFTMDFQTTAGTTYANEIPGFLGNPTGTINRQDESPIFNSHWYFDNDWSNAINTQLTSAPFSANLQLEYNYFAQTNALFIHTESEFKSNLTGDYNLIIYLVRDTVIAPQEYSGSIDHHYHHHAVLSDNINGTWGTSIVSGNATNGDIYYNDYSFQLPDPSSDSTYNINNLSLITYLCERNTFEVIQVIKTELAP